MSDKEIKVTDRRMFTADGQLREEYRDIASGAAAATAAPEPAPPPAVEEPARKPEPVRAPEPPPAEDRTPRLEIPTGPPGAPAAAFYDLVAVLAEPIPLYLGDVELPGGQKVENLEMARLHIDLLEVLRQKTAGNLSAQELGFLEDLLYRSRLRYVQKRG